MRTVISILIILGMSTSIFGQPSAKALEENQTTLKDRYKLMKDGSQTYESYKVIKENVLDSFWKITMDSLSNEKAKYHQASEEVSLMQQKVKTAMDSINIQKASMSEIIFDSNHISVLGLPFSKAFFLILVAVLMGGLIFFSLGLLTRMKVLSSLVKEKTLIADSISNEFEEFKKRAMEKQTKLSRELQNERNKIFESRK